MKKFVLILFVVLASCSKTVQLQETEIETVTNRRIVTTRQYADGTVEKTVIDEQIKQEETTVKKTTPVKEKRKTRRNLFILAGVVFIVVGIYAVRRII